MFGQSFATNGLSELNRLFYDSLDVIASHERVSSEKLWSDKNVCQVCQDELCTYLPSVLRERTGHGDDGRRQRVGSKYVLCTKRKSDVCIVRLVSWQVATQSWGCSDSGPHVSIDSRAQTSTPYPTIPFDAVPGRGPSWPEKEQPTVRYRMSQRCYWKSCVFPQRARVRPLTLSDI